MIYFNDKYQVYQENMSNNKAEFMKKIAELKNSIKMKSKFSKKCSNIQ